MGTEQSKRIDDKQSKLSKLSTPLVQADQTLREEYKPSKHDYINQFVAYKIFDISHNKGFYKLSLCVYDPFTVEIKADEIHELMKQLVDMIQIDNEKYCKYRTKSMKTILESNIEKIREVIGRLG